MDATERTELIEILMIFEGKAESYYQSMTDKELETYYADYLKKGEPKRQTKD